MATDPSEFLSSRRTAVLDAAVDAVGRSHARHYEAAGADEVRARLETLYGHVERAAAARDLGAILDYAQRLAEERFNAGYDLAEIQIAVNALEEAIWSRVFEELEPSELAGMLGLVSTILGATKDALARAYVSLATRTHSPSLDLRSLFAGNELA